MPKNILIDLSVILDVLLERTGYEDSSRIIQLAESDSYTLSISAHMVTTFAYLLESAKVPRSQILQHIDWLVHTFTVVPIDKTVLQSALQSALQSSVGDYEDAVVEQAAVTSGATAIVTRHIKDFRASAIPAITPRWYLARC